MSWLSDRYADFTNTVGEVGKFGAEHFIPGGSNDVANFFQTEFIDKKELRGAQIEAIMSGLPIIGGIQRGVDGVQQLEDLYNRTGKVPAYPGATSGSSAGIGKSISGIARKIENGTHDLAEYYSGEKLGPMPVEGVDYVTGDKFVNQ